MRSDHNQWINLHEELQAESLLRELREVIDTRPRQSNDKFGALELVQTFRDGPRMASLYRDQNGKIVKISVEVQL